MQAPGQVAAVLNNWGAAGRATVQFPRATRTVVEILSGASIGFHQVGDIAEAEIELKKGASAVLLAATA